MMEQSSKFLSLSGLSGVSAGTVALTGAGTAYWRLSRQDSAAGNADLTAFFSTDAVLVLALAIGLAIFFTTRMAKKKASRSGRAPPAIFAHEPARSARCGRTLLALSPGITC